MTDKLHCPFCGAELAPHIDEWKSIRKLFICNNTGCFCWGQPMLLEIWQALIDGKKAQEALNVATEALSKIDTFDCHGKGAIEIMAGMVSIANSALYEITSITKRE